MTNDTHNANSNQNNTVGAGGTVRVNPAPSGAQGTVRVGSTPDQGAGGTVRVGTPDAGAQGTVRVGAAGNAGTSGAATTSTVLGQLGQVATDQQRLGVGQVVQLNGTDYTVVSELSSHTSEANTYIVNSGAGTQVLKRYKNGVRMPVTVLQAIKDHPHGNVVAVNDIGHADGHDCELLEFVAGGSLADHLRHYGPIKDLAVLRDLVRGLADGLNHLHDQVRMIYQDLKPENVLLADAQMSRVMLADFGISTLMKPSAAQVDVTANGTREYAAPELWRFGNQTSVLVTAAVDYFALGITLLECWTASRPFQNVLDGVRSNQILNQSVPFPPDLDESLAALIKGLIKPLAQDRFGPLEVQRWLDGLPLNVDYGKVARQYKTQWFDDEHSYDTPAQLALLLEADPAKGLDYLYLDMIHDWLDDAGDMTRSAAIRKIVREFNGDDVRRNAGLMKAIYTLDNELPFETDGGQSCRTQEEMGDALQREKAYYIEELRDPLAPFYLYLQANGAGDFADATYARFRSKNDSVEFAFNAMVYALHEGGQHRLRLEGRYWHTVDDFNAASDSEQASLLNELRRADSRGLIWLQKQNIIAKLAPLDATEAVDLISIVKVLPWIKLKTEISSLDDNRVARLAVELLRLGRADLLEVFARQGLPLDVQANKWSPLAWASRAGQLDAVRRLLDLGARVDYTASNSPTALDAAIRYRRSDVVEFLLTRGADVNQLTQGQETMLTLACRKLKVDGDDKPVDPLIVRLLLQAGAPVNLASGMGEFALHLVIAESELGDVVDLFDALIDAGARPAERGRNVVLPDASDCDALFCALYAYKFKRHRDEVFLPIVKRLTALGASLDAVHDGKAPLHFAASINDQALTELLLQNGASISQVVDGDMLPAAHAAQVGAAKLAKLLSPGSELKLRNSVLRFLALCGRLLVYFLLLLNLIPLGAMVGSALAGDPTRWVWCWVGSLLMLTALGLSRTGSLAGFLRGLKSGLRNSWFKLLVILPLVVLALSFGVHYVLLNLLGGVPSVTLQFIVEWSEALPFVAAFAVLLSMAITRRAAPISRAFYKLEEATAKMGGKGQKTPSDTKWVVIFLIILIGGVLILGQKMSGNVSLDLLGPSQASLLGQTDDPNPKVGVLANQGELTQAFKASMGKTTVCTLPAGTALSSIKPSSSSGTPARYQVKVPQPGGDCEDKLKRGLFMNIPQDLVTFAGKPSVKASVAPVKKSGISGKTDVVTGTVTKLSVDGWPVINGATMPLFGVAAIAPSQTSRFESWLSASQHELECELQPGNRWRCFNRKNADVALGLLLNGVARATDDAPAEYRQAMEKAVAESRGQWK